MIARIYGIRPWEMLDLSPAEYSAIAEDLKALEQANKQ